MGWQHRPALRSASTGAGGSTTSAIILGAGIANSAGTGISGDLIIPNIQGVKSTQCNWRSSWLDQSAGFYSNYNGGGGRLANGNITGALGRYLFRPRDVARKRELGLHMANLTPAPQPASAAATPAAPDSPLPEIEITPEMIQAGVRELSECHSDFFDPEDVVESVYRSMRLKEPARLAGSAAASIERCAHRKSRNRTRQQP